MRSTKVAGIVFTNAHDELMKELTASRSMASVPFGGRYRLIDFPLSNLVNAGVTDIGLVIRENYRSLIDHVGSGVYWDLDRKNGGLHLMPPYNTSGTNRYGNYIEALYGAMDFVNRCNAEYIITYNSDIVANVDISNLVKTHLDKKADITLVYTHGTRPSTYDEAIGLSVDSDGRVKGYADTSESDGETDYSMSIFIFSNKVLKECAKQAYYDNNFNFRGVIQKYKVYGYRHDGFTALMDSEMDYYEASMKLLDAKVRDDLFCKERPILTKTRDDMPTRYGTHSKVENCFIADGCVIEGTVKNSVLFRGVKVKKGAVVENSILMQETEVEPNAHLYKVVTDKNAVISEGIVSKGTDKNIFFIRKNQIL